MRYMQGPAAYGVRLRCCLPFGSAWKLVLYLFFGTVAIEVGERVIVVCRGLILSPGRPREFSRIPQGLRVPTITRRGDAHSEFVGALQGKK